MTRDEYRESLEHEVAWLIQRLGLPWSLGTQEYAEAEIAIVEAFTRLHKIASLIPKTETQLVATQGATIQ